MLHTKANSSALVAGDPVAMLSHNAFGSKAIKSNYLDFIDVFHPCNPLKLRKIYFSRFIASVTSSRHFFVHEIAL